jgi:FkbM family methyltransferase
MLIPLDFLVQKYGIRFLGILHVGAHECEEILNYDKYIGRDKVLWVEALSDKVEFCKSSFPDILIEQAVVSDVVETVTFHRSNNGQSSSILEFGTHSYHHPHVKFIEEFQCQTARLDSILGKYDIPYNFLNLDIQGVELRALKSMESYLSSVDYIYTEVNSDYVYKDCGLVSEIDSYLYGFGFVRVETAWHANTGWGDAFYMKQK